MAVTAKLYTNALKQFLMGNITWKASGGSTIKCALLKNTYTPDQDVHDFFDDVSAHEATGTGYTAGGATLTKIDPAVVTASNEIRMDASDISWAASTITARYAVIYYSTGTASTSNLIGYIDFGADMSSAAGAFTITLDATGLFKITVA